MKIRPSLIFGGNAEEAMTFYVSLFPNSQIVELKRYGAEDPGVTGQVSHGEISLSGEELFCSDSLTGHGYGFTPTMSFLIACESAEEIKRLSEGLEQGGELLGKVEDYPSALKFFFVIDRFGVAWQLILP